MKGSIGPMLHLGQWMIDVEVDKGPWPAAAAPTLRNESRSRLRRKSLHRLFPYDA